MDLVGQERCEHIFQGVLLASLVRCAMPADTWGSVRAAALGEPLSFFGLSFFSGAWWAWCSPRRRACPSPRRWRWLPHRCAVPAASGAKGCPWSWACVKVLTLYLRLTHCCSCPPSAPALACVYASPLVRWPRQVAAFGVGWVRESISLSYMVLGAGVTVGGLLCTPNWGMFNRHPLTFASAEALEEDMAAAVPEAKGRAGGKAAASR